MHEVCSLQRLGQQDAGCDGIMKYTEGFDLFIDQY